MPATAINGRRIGATPELNSGSLLASVAQRRQRFTGACPPETPPLGSLSDLRSLGAMATLYKIYPASHVDGTTFGPSLRNERLRGGEMFPHLHGLLDPAAAIWVKPLPLGPDGGHVFPDLAS
jgi:hypothetical protein